MSDMIEQVTIEGRAATVAYITHTMEAATKEQHDGVKVLFNDGDMQIAFKQEAPMIDPEFAKMGAEPLTKPLTVYRALAEGKHGAEFTNEDYTSFTTDKTVLEGLGSVVSLDLPAGTPVAQLPEDGEVVLDKGTTFRVNGNTLEVVSAEEVQQKAADHATISSMPDVNFDPPPSLPTNITDFLNQIQYIEPIDDWRTTPDTAEDGEQADEMFGMNMSDEEVGSNGPQQYGSTEAALVAAPAATIDLSPITEAARMLSEAVAASRFDMTPLVQAITQQKAPEVVVQSPTMDITPLLAAVTRLAAQKPPEITVSAPAPMDITPLLAAIAANKAEPIDLTPLIKAMAASRIEIDYKALALAFKSIMPTPAQMPAPIDLTPLTLALERGMAAQAEAIRNMPAPQVIVQQRPLLTDIKFDLDEEGNVSRATLN